MTSEEFEKLDILERLKIQTICIDISTANSLYENAKAHNEEKLFFSAFVGAISKDRTSKEKNVYTRYFNDINIKAYNKQKGQSIGGKKSKRTAAKPKANKNDNSLNLQ